MRNVPDADRFAVSVCSVCRGQMSQMSQMSNSDVPDVQPLILLDRGTPDA